ncbi:hypothetical protein [Afipia sp. P52-10]|uniref:hypothetical protein n=1 Tax=Afipia sp. P52-10 TaxID=1429916 RepID=UPI0012681A84|nr:hypothetical protein [Afipia sp. P52-10]
MPRHFAEIAAAIWNEDRQAIAELQDMTANDVKRVEAALFAERGFQLDLTSAPDDILASVREIKTQKSQLAVD